ncbi:MAG: hypothetical protein EAZ55_12650 [Cytophagales bacterium]|nr:MAG: hypothetical protein EAZ55_12650 [Cytophagales bacterium]
MSMKSLYLSILLIGIISLLKSNVQAQNNSIESLKKTIQKDKKDIAEVNALTELGRILQVSQPQQAIQYAEQAETIAKKINYQEGLADAWALKADITAFQEKRPDKAIKWYEDAYRSYQKLYEKQLIGKAKIYNFLTNSALPAYKILIEQGELTQKDKKALKKYKDLHADMSEYVTQLAITTNEKLQKTQTELKYSDVKLKSQEWQKTLLEIEKEMLKDSLVIKELIEKALTDSLIRQEFTIKDKTIEILKEKAKTERLEYESEVKNLENNRLRWIITSIAVTLVLIVLLTLILIRFNRVQKKNNLLLAKQREEIDHKNQQIIGSITYASRIQEAILPRPQELTEAFGNLLVFFKPRDIVSGDFYWLAETPPEPIFGLVETQRGRLSAFRGIKGSKRIFAAIDCTGHGVPGAFMSMIGYTLLNEIVFQRNIIQPNQILIELHKGIIDALKQGQTRINDGMDLALCVIDEEQKQMQFAGAKNALLYFQNGTAHFIRGSKYPIGGIFLHKEEDREYQIHTIDISQKTTCYMYSDGFQDQFNARERKKFMSNRFRDLLAEIHTLPFEQQHTTLEKTFEEWKGDTKQTDDVLIVGFQVGNEA